MWKRILDNHVNLSETSCRCPNGRPTAQKNRSRLEKLATRVSQTLVEVRCQQIGLYLHCMQSALRRAYDLKRNEKKRFQTSTNQINLQA